MRKKGGNMLVENIIDKYLDEVVSYIDCTENEANDIKSKMKKTLENIRDKNMNFDPYRDFGKPHLIAKRIQREYLQENYPNKFEYKSKKELFGLPLVHINKRRGGIAKGIIAIGTISFGFITLIFTPRTQSPRSVPPPSSDAHASPLKSRWEFPQGRHYKPAFPC